MFNILFVIKYRVVSYTIPVRYDRHHYILCEKSNTIEWVGGGAFTRYYNINNIRVLYIF